MKADFNTHTLRRSVGRFPVNEAFSARIRLAASRRRVQGHECRFRVGTSSSHGREAVVRGGVTRPASARVSCMSLAAVRPHAGHGVERQRDVGEREWTRRLPPAAPAGKLPVVVGVRLRQVVDHEGLQPQRDWLPMPARPRAPGATAAVPRQSDEQQSGAAKSCATAATLT
jgi:hypothetical protein